MNLQDLQLSVNDPLSVKDTYPAANEGFGIYPHPAAQEGYQALVDVIPQNETIVPGLLSKTDLDILQLPTEKVQLAMEMSKINLERYKEQNRHVERMKELEIESRKFQ